MTELSSTARGLLLALVSTSMLAACGGGGGGGGGTSLGSGTLSWIAPSTREDTSAISLSEIDSYRILYGFTSGDYDGEILVDGSSTSVQFSNIPTGTYFAVVTAVDAKGRESLISGESEVIVQ